MEVTTAKMTVGFISDKKCILILTEKKNIKTDIDNLKEKIVCKW